MENNSSKGSLIGSIIVVLILLVGGIYLYLSQTRPPVANTDLDQEWDNFNKEVD